MPTVRSANQPLYPPHARLVAGDMASEAGWTTALRALLLLNDAPCAADPLLARLTDDDLSLLRTALVALNAVELTSAA